MEAFGLPYTETEPPEGNLTIIQGTFQRMHRTATLDPLMAGMARLYDKGYRLTAGDRAALNQVIG